MCGSEELQAKADSAERNAWTRPAAEQLADGVYRIPLPMPGDHLKAVNVYALEEPGGLTLIDGGWAQPAARAALEAGLTAIGARPSAIKRVLVTHAHRDHYTLAVILRREFGTPIALGAGEQSSMAVITSDVPSPNYGSQVSLLRAAGAGGWPAWLRRRPRTWTRSGTAGRCPTSGSTPAWCPRAGPSSPSCQPPGTPAAMSSSPIFRAACCSPVTTCCRTSPRRSVSRRCRRPRRSRASSSRSPSCGRSRTCGCCRPTGRRRQLPRAGRPAGGAPRRAAGRDPPGGGRGR